MKAASFKTQKAYFRGNAKFGRTTQLVKDGVVVDEFMGACSLKDCIKSYNRKCLDQVTL